MNEGINPKSYVTATYLSPFATLQSRSVPTSYTYFIYLVTVDILSLMISRYWQVYRSM